MEGKPDPPHPYVDSSDSCSSVYSSFEDDMDSHEPAATTTLLPPQVSFSSSKNIPKFLYECNGVVIYDSASRVVT